MKTGMAAISLVILLSLSLVGCQSKIVETITSTPSAEEVVDGVIEAVEDITSVTFKADLAVDMTGEEDGEAVDAAMITKVTGAVDVVSKDGKIDMSVTIDSTGEDTFTADMTMYFIDDILYALMEMPALGNISMWVKTDVPPEMHGQMTQVEDQVELLKLSEVRFAGTETVNGKECYVLELVPDPDALWEFISERMNIAGAPVPGIEEETIIRDIARSYSAKQWIDIDSFLLSKSEMDMEIEIEDTSLDINMSLLVSSYNQPVNIELPEEAENAIEMPSSQLFPR